MPERQETRRSIRSSLEVPVIVVERALARSLMAFYKVGSICSPCSAVRDSPISLVKTMLRVLTATILAGSSITYAAEVYRWVDPNGGVQYSDSVPEHLKSKAKRVEIPRTDAREQEAAASRLSADKAKAEALAKQRQTSNAAPPVSAVAKAPPAPPQAATSCGDQWSRYFASQACFNPYRNANGSVKAEAFQRCTDVPAPACGPAPAVPGSTTERH